jgi:hypothetical protein
LTRVVRLRTYPPPSRRKFTHDAGPPESGVGVVLAFIVLELLAFEFRPIDVVGF